MTSTRSKETFIYICSSFKYMYTRYMADSIPLLSIFKLIENFSDSASIVWIQRVAGRLSWVGLESWLTDWLVPLTTPRFNVVPLLKLFHLISWLNACNDSILLQQPMHMFITMLSMWWRWRGRQWSCSHACQLCFHANQPTELNRIKSKWMNWKL